MADNTRSIDMTKGRPIGLMIRFALPMMVGSVFQSLYAMVDSAVLGRYVGSHALAAIGATTSTTGFFLFVAMGVTNAVSIVLSQFVGANDEDKSRACVVSAAYLTLAMGLALGLLGVIAARPLMRLLETPAEIIDMSVLYVQLICGFGLAQFAYNMIAAILRALGDSKTPLYFLILCSILNVALDLVSVLVLNMGVAGVAVATLVSQAISAAACIFVMFRKYPHLRFSRASLRPDMAILTRTLRMGMQMAVQSAFLTVGMMVITRVINGFGADVVAAFTVGSNVQSLAVMLFSNFAFGFSVYVGQNYGAALYGRIRLGVRQMLALVGGLAMLACALSLVFAEPLVLLYVNARETTVVKASLELVRVQAWFYPFLGWIWLYSNTLKGMGKIGVTMVSSFVELGSKIGFSLLLPIWFGYTGIWYSAPLGWILGIVPYLFYYYGRRWEPKGD